MFYKITNYGHHAQCLSPTQVAPGHVSEILTMNTEGVKPENPELRKMISLCNLYLTDYCIILFQTLITLLFQKLLKLQENEDYEQ